MRPSRRALLAALAAGVPVNVSSRPRLHAQDAVRVGTLGRALRTVTLNATLDHPQGLVGNEGGTIWWVTSVLRGAKAGLLAAFRAADGMLLQSTDVQQGPCYHPGGISRLGDALWLPVAEYRAQSTSVVQCRDTQSLALRTAFPVADHIGALAVTSGALIGCNWDARRFYEWTFEGRQVQAVEHPGAARYQDMKWAGDAILAGGLLGDQGVIDLLAWPSLDLRERTVVGRTDRGVVLTHEGLAVSGDQLLLMPEDEPTRVFVYPWAPRA